jgi:transcriptional regulator with XRE-family HTH domain
MKGRILEFLRSENKSSAQLADEIGVQPSGISHILSGRNNPSLDFVLKMLERYKYLSTDWLLFGKGEMYREKQYQSLFDETLTAERENKSDTDNSFNPDKSVDFQEFSPNIPVREAAGHPLPGKIKVVKIVWFYDNNSFEEFLPR